MSKDKKDLKSILASFKHTLKDAFSDKKDNTTAEPAEGSKGQFAGATACYNITGAAPVYVDISDDSIPDIDVNDLVYADAQGTTPYPDGTYTVDGTQFSFTVAMGKVTNVMDAANSGPGQPVQQVQPQPAPSSVPQPMFNINLPESFAAFKTQMESEKGKFNAEEAYTEILSLVGKFATGSADDRLTSVETMCKALMNYCFGYKLQDIETQQAINAYASTLGTFKSQLESRDKQVNSLKEVNEKLIGLFEEFLAIPGKEPETLNDKDKEKFNQQEKKEKKLEKYAASLKEIREGRNKK